MNPESFETILIEEHEAQTRLDKVLAHRFPTFSRTYFQYLIERALVLIEGKPVKKRIQLNVGDEVEIQFALTPDVSLEPEPIPLNILFEDEHLLAINKPAGLVVHPGAGNPSGTFVNALLYHCKSNVLYPSDRLRPGIVHRLDKDTTGVLIAAKTEAAHHRLVELFSTRRIHKEYLAICIGNPGVCFIEGNIGRHPIKRKEMAIVQEGGRSAKTRCEKVTWNGFLSLVSLYPETGRTHQLRVHLKSIGTPILGDGVYGSASANQRYEVSRQLLHAATLQFPHPMSGEDVVLKAPLPADMLSFLKTQFRDFDASKLNTKLRLINL